MRTSQITSGVETDTPCSPPVKLSAGSKSFVRLEVRCLTTGSSHSLRSFGTAFRGPLTKRYVQRMNMDFTPEEKAVVAQCLAEDPSMKRTLSLYWPYIISLCVAAAYGFFEENYLISSASFFFLICEII